MRHVIIGTAGHIDHGKTALIKALTGRNTDRWEEEQRRGITIDLGFTYFDLPSRNRVGIIDVPGHENFIHNMVAGVVGMDLVLLVVAADEGIMPQTREHLDILSLLGIKNTILVLNKCDLVEEDWLEMIREEIKEELAGTIMEHAPMIEVSSVTMAGIDRLTEAIDEMTTQIVNVRNIYTIPRLPIDRVFTLSGLGTIVTGTLVSGTVHKGDTLTVYPIAEECRIRSIQVHGADTETAYAGQRVALNLSGVDKEKISRGTVLAPVGSMHCTTLLDVRLFVLPDAKHPVKNQSRLHFFSGTSEILCRAILLDKEEILPGESGLVQLRLEAPTALRKGDRFVVRFYSPLETIGGGEILEPNPRREKRFVQEVIDNLLRKESGDLKDVLELHIQNSADLTMNVRSLAKLSGVSAEEVREAVMQLQNDRLVLSFLHGKDLWVWDTAGAAQKLEKVKEALRELYAAHPYRPGLRKELIRSRFFSEAKPSVFDCVVEYWTKYAGLRQDREYLVLSDYAPPKDSLFLQVSGQILETFSARGYDFARFHEMEFEGVPRETVEDILQMLITEGSVVKLAEDRYSLSTLIDAARSRIETKLAADGVISYIEARDMFQTGRSCAKLLMEYMDAIHVTRCNGKETERIPYR